MNRILGVKRVFEAISFMHIYGESNTQADQLSKEALSLQEGSLAEKEFSDGVLISQTLKCLFFNFWSRSIVFMLTDMMRASFLRLFRMFIFYFCMGKSL